MPIKFVAEVLKGLFGISEQSNEEAETETSITVEREIGEASESESSEADESSAVESAGESEVSGEAADASGEPVDDIRGIGPTYSERLAGIDIVTVGDLVDADVSEVADAAEVSESRAADWLSEAEDR